MRNKADTSSTGAGLAAPESRGSLPNSLDRLTEIKARVARYKEELSGMRRSNDSFWVSDLEYALAELERLQWDVEAKDVEWKLQEEMKDKAIAERDRLRAALKGISKLGNLTLLGGSAMDSERAHEAGAHEAFSQAADIARSALGADYVQEG